MAFCIQSNFGSPTTPVTEDSFYKVIRDKNTKNVITEVRLGKALARDAAEIGEKELARTFTNEANEVKKKLPGFIFQSTFMATKSKRSGVLGTWRRQSASILNGLCMIDVDHLGDSFESPSQSVVSAAETSGTSGQHESARQSVVSAVETSGTSGQHESPSQSVVSAAESNKSAAALGARETFEAFRQKVDFEKEGIMLVYITPSGHGLKIVFKARLEWGNLIDNQHQMAALLGVEVDEACKDSSRLSFICTEKDVLFINKEIFTYENKEYGERWNEAYRRGNSKATKYDNCDGHSGSSMGRGNADCHGAVGNGKDVEGDGEGADGDAEMKEGKEEKEARTKEGKEEQARTEKAERPRERKQREQKREQRKLRWQRSIRERKRKKKRKRRR